MSISQSNRFKTQDDFPSSPNECVKYLVVEDALVNNCFRARKVSLMKAINSHANLLLAAVLMAMWSTYAAAKPWRGIVPCIQRTPMLNAFLEHLPSRTIPDFTTTWKTKQSFLLSSVKKAETAAPNACRLILSSESRSRRGSDCNLPTFNFEVTGSIRSENFSC